MIVVSELAKRALLERLQTRRVSSAQGLRLKVGADGFLLGADHPTSQDRVIRHENAMVVIVDPAVEDAVGDAIIDITESPQGPELVFRPVPRDDN